MAPRFHSRPTAFRQPNDAVHHYLSMQWQCDHLAGANILGSLDHALPVNPDVAGLDQPLSLGAALQQANEVEVPVQTHAYLLSPASAAKALPGLGPCGARRRGRRWPRHDQASPAGTKPISAIKWRMFGSSRPRLVTSARSTGSSPPC